MATKNEKIISTVIGTTLGALVGYIIAESKDVKPVDRWQYILGGAVVGGLGGLFLASIFGSKNDTVNYQLYNGKKLVYYGITYDSRINSREKEHVSSGKIFTRMVVDAPKPREEALALEKNLIRRDRPFYNIQHNQY